MGRSTTVISPKSACRKQKFDDASQWLLEDWIKTGKGRNQEKISILCEPKLSQPIPVPSSNSRTLRRKCCWSCCKTKTDSERIYRVPPPRRERVWIEFHNRKWINSRRKKPEERKTSGVLHYSEPDGWWIWYGRNSTRSDETKDRAIQEYLKTVSKYCILVQFEVRSRERLAILPNTIRRNRPLSHTACSLYWESGMYENTGWALPEGSLNSERATCRTKFELAIRLTGSTKPRRKIILGTIKRFEKLRVNL